MNKKYHKELIAVYTKDGAYIDVNMTNLKGGFYDEKLLSEFDSDFYYNLFHFGFNDINDKMSPSLSFLYKLSKRFIEVLSKSPDIEFTGTYKPIDEESLEDMLSEVPFALGSEFINEQWLSSVWRKMGLAFSRDLKSFNGTFADYLHYYNAGLNVFGKVYLHLVERKDRDFPFAFMATYTRKVEGLRKPEHLPLKNALTEFTNDRDELIKLLSTVEKATKNSSFLKDLLDSGELFSPLKFTSDDAYTFLNEIAVYEEAGIICRIPNWWKQKSSGIGLQLSIGDENKNLLGLDTLLSVQPSLTIDGKKLSPREIASITDMTEGLVMLKGRWVSVNHKRLQEIMEAFERLDKMKTMTLGESMRFQMGLDEENEDILKELTVTNGEWLKSVMDKMRNPIDKTQHPLSENFKATLRKYQTQGFNWLNTMYELKFGALLADDMGLGKTIQVLSLLDHLQETSSTKSLLVIPVSLISNWSEEIEKFVPTLKYSIIHNKYDGSLDDNATLFITTYSMVRKIDRLKEINWDILILDEAQAIKNSGTKQTRAIKQIPAGFKVALTGTPIENNLGDLWSIFDFLNPGLLGSAKEFTTFLKADDAQKTNYRIKQTIEPFILRRLKTDTDIIDDLPPKIELKAYSVLTAKQRVLYRKMVEQLRESVEEKTGIERKGIVLASLTKFKQICNHPSHYLGQEAYNPKDSGKFEKLKEICEVIRDKHEKVLIFTQYREIVEPLAEYLSELFGQKGLIMHGSVPASKRGQIIKEFNENKHIPFMVLSLKAGGVGLNLTAANHVVHFDRWWNPAVENQATDRAFRIGQTKKVIVHKFVTEDTLEEKIDIMIEEKQKLADDIIGSTGEKWLTEFDNDELIKLVQLD